MESAWSKVQNDPERAVDAALVIVGLVLEMSFFGSPSLALQVELLGTCSPHLTSKAKRSKTTTICECLLTIILCAGLVEMKKKRDYKKLSWRFAENAKP